MKEKKKDEIKKRAVKQENEDRTMRQGKEHNTMKQYYYYYSCHDWIVFIKLKYTVSAVLSYINEIGAPSSRPSPLHFIRMRR